MVQTMQFLKNFLSILLKKHAQAELTNLKFMSTIENLMNEVHSYPKNLILIFSNPKSRFCRSLRLGSYRQVHKILMLLVPKVLLKMPNFRLKFPR